MKHAKDEILNLVAHFWNCYQEAMRERLAEDNDAPERSKAYVIYVLAKVAYDQILWIDTSLTGGVRNSFDLSDVVKCFWEGYSLQDVNQMDRVDADLNLNGTLTELKKAQEVTLCNLPIS